MNHLTEFLTTLFLKQCGYHKMWLSKPQYVLCGCDQALSQRSLPGLKHDSMLSEPAGWLQPRLMERT